MVHITPVAVFPPSALAACSIHCSHFPPRRPIPADGAPSSYSRPFAYHQLGCGCDESRDDRHEAIAATVGDGLRPEGPFRVDLRRGLSSSASKGTKVDLNLTSYARHPPTTSLDITVTCPFSISYLAAAAKDSAAVFAARDREKRSKHLAGSAEQGRAYFTMCFTTLGGIGPPETLAFIDAVFAASASRELAATGSARAAHLRRSDFYAAVHATLTAASTVMICRHTRTRPSDVTPSDAAGHAADNARAELARADAAAAANPPPPARDVAIAALDAAAPPTVSPTAPATPNDPPAPAAH